MAEMEIERPSCPYEDLSSTTIPTEKSCPFHHNRHEQPHGTIDNKINTRVILGMYWKSDGSAKLLQDIGGGDRIRQMSTRFYAHFFRDFTLQKFAFANDGAANHGQRLGDWIIEKMGGEGNVWSDSGRKNMRSVSHSKAWHSDSRSKEDIGKRFKLDDCRIWMRLMFLSAREIGLNNHTPFWKWYIGFIKHYISIYHSSASKYAAESAEWSADFGNIERYAENGYKMNDVIGIKS